MSNTPSFGLIINGEDVIPHDSSSYAVNNPISGKVVHFAPAASQGHVDKCVDGAQSAFHSWGFETSPLQRRELFFKAKEIFQSRSDEFLASMMLETGCGAGWGAFNVMLGAQMIQEAGSLATAIEGKIIRANEPGCYVYHFKEPAGVSLGIAPWNAPLILGLRSFLTPLVCGNTTIIKGSEISPYTQYLLVDTFRRAGFPPGVVSYLSFSKESAPELTEALIAHRSITRVNFTGSTLVGRKIALTCAKHLKKCVLELGGKAPMIVFPDADLEEAVKAAAFGAFMHQGQVCMSTERIIVHEDVKEQFEKQMAAKTRSLHAADPGKDENAPLAALFSSSSEGRMSSLVGRLTEAGAKDISNHPQTNSGPIVQPTLLSLPHSNGPLEGEEFFGPLLTTMPFKTEEEAIEIANGTPYGLTSSVFTKDLSRGFRVARLIKSGATHVNGPTVFDEPHIPLGGLGDSGWGRFGGIEALNEFLEDKCIVVHSGAGKFPI